MTNLKVMQKEPNTLPSVFSSTREFRNVFEQGLTMLLTHCGVGEFILVCANASIEPKIEKHLSAAIRHCFEEYEKEIAEHPEKIIDSSHEDDIAVYFHMEALGIENVGLSRSRMEGPWELQFNKMRSFRPKRNSVKRIETTCIDYDSDAFHFNKPFLKDEIMWHGEVLGREVDLFYNKFPFAPLHSLLVIEKEKCIPQYLQREYHEYVWSLTEALEENIPGIGFGYNAMGAFSSVNHLHFQLFVRLEAMPVERDTWVHNGGPREYPIQCAVFEDVSEAWSYIDKLHQENITYNLLYRPGHIYCFPRNFQGTFRQAGWTTGFTWIDLCGEILVPKTIDYEVISSDDIDAEFEKLRIKQN